MTQRLRCGFSHDYCKLHGQTSARLLDVKRIKKNDIDPEAYHYDTLFYELSDKWHERVYKFYVIKGEDLLRMTFIGNLGIPFTTYRTDTPEHFRKYADNIGKVFEIYVKEDAK